MTYTWGEIQVLSIQKMFLNNESISTNELSSLKTDRKYELYLNGMPSVANEALLRLMSVGKPLVKKYSLSYDIPDSIFDYQSYETEQITTNDLEIQGNASKAYYFEINNDATIYIQQYTTEWETISTITHTATKYGVYETKKGLIDNENKNPIRLLFKADDYVYSVRNVALYNINFKDTNNIYNNTQKQKYDLAELIDDFYDIISVEFEKEDEKNKYNSNFILEEDKTLVFDTKMKGNFIITYKAYPEKITSTTADSHTFEMPSEMIALLPLYIASELYKDDDISVATTWRNQFEVALSEIEVLEEPIDYADTQNVL